MTSLTRVKFRIRAGAIGCLTKSVPQLEWFQIRLRVLILTNSSVEVNSNNSPVVTKPKFCFLFAYVEALKSREDAIKVHHQLR